VLTTPSPPYLLLSARFLGSLLSVKSEFPSACGHYGVHKVASEGISSRVCVQQELWA